MASDGILLTGTTKAVTTPALKSGESPKATKQADDGKAHITLYEDLQCPVCKSFEEANDAQIAQWLDAGQATLEIHPISFLDASSNGNKYSTRAANAMACVAQYDPDKFWAVNKAFYDNQPEENGNGLTDKQIIANIKTGGVSDSKVSECVTSQKFVDWVKTETDRVMDGKKKVPNSSLAKVEGTPTIIVNGQSYTPPTSSQTGYADADAFATFVSGISTAVAQGGASSTPSATPAG
jgi:protein-disulfide isomerase